jgi:diguanylate cyclase (GGDEF)-like protein
MMPHESASSRLSPLLNKDNNKEIRVLLIEDNPEYPGLLKRMLAKEKRPSFHLDSFNNLQAGLQHLAKGETDIVLLDLNLPDSRGLDTFASVQTQAPSVPIIILTGFDDESLGLEAVGKGAQDYLVKGQVEGKMLARVMRYAIERKRAEEAVADLAIRDSLTNLYNRRYFNYRIEEEIAQADRNKHVLAILLCDLDHFKAINDARGHQVGDEVLKAVARSIREATRGTDLIFRWGGDEVAVVLPNTTREGILIAAERIRSGIRTVGEKDQLGLDLSIGVALHPEHGRSIDELIRLADRALYIAKKGGDKVHIGEEEYPLDENAVSIVFQPVVDIRSDQVLGYEALSRDPQGKLSILELFKRYEAVGHLTELKNLCFNLQLKKALESGLKRVFINVDFKVLAKTEPQSKPAEIEVILEISEAECLHDIADALRITRKWREKGYKFAIDDFGGGFLSLPFLAQLIPNYIKLDRSTILQSVSSQSFRVFLKDLIFALQNYSTEGIIAEGVETEKEFKAVTDIGIHLFQGFLLGRPK